MQTPAPSRTPQDASNFYEGVDSFSDPLFLKPTQYRWGENCVCRGGTIQTRPGFDTRLAFDVTVDPFKTWWNNAGKPKLWPQGFCVFWPSNSQPYAVFAVSGSVWNAPILPNGFVLVDQAQQIEELQFLKQAKQIVFTPCVQSADITGQGTKIPITPQNILIIQDGSSRAGYWTGVGGGHFNPLKKITTDYAGNTYFTPGYNGTRIGLWQAWSGNRLWVSDGRVVRASDLGDPTHFTEELVAGLVPQFIFPNPVTAVTDRGTSGTTSSAVVIHTYRQTWIIYSGVQDRTQWASTPNFATCIFDGTGCIAGKSPIKHRGLLYWRAQDGIVVFDSVGTVYATQLLPPCDYEEQISKRLMAPDLSSMCSGYSDSYLFFSGPYGPVLNGRLCNGHTQVLDRQTTTVHAVSYTGPFAYGTSAWQGVWTGVRPVEWATDLIAGTEHTYCFSMDQDGVPRIWEGMQGDRSDNGQPIPWYFITRAHVFGPNSLFEFSKFRHFRLLLDRLYGTLQINGSWKGLRGEWKQILSYACEATPGGILTPYPGNVPFTQSTPFESLTSQTRYIRSPDVRAGSGCPTNCTSAGVESQKVDDTDNAFMLLFQFVGRASVRAYYMAADKHEDLSEGAVIAPETGFHLLPESGCPQSLVGTPPAFYFLSPGTRLDALTPSDTRLPEIALYQAPAS